MQRATHSLEAPTPFIDRLSITLKVPSQDDAFDIHSGIWGQLKDEKTFTQAKNQGSYKLARRIILPSVPDHQKWPYFQYAHADHMATGLRLDFVPVDLGLQGLTELHAALISIVPDGWAYFVEYGNVTRLDVAVDFPDGAMADFHFLPRQGATTKTWAQKGEMQTFQHGLAKGNHTQIYNREAKRKAQGKGHQGKTSVRVERRLKGSVGALHKLAELPNPFKDFTLVQRVPGPPIAEKHVYVWNLFTEQIPSEIGECDGCIVMTWPWFLDFKIKRVLEGPVHGRVIRALSIQHTYYAPAGYRVWLLRKNSAGGFNVMGQDGDTHARHCARGVPAAVPYLEPGRGRNLDEMRDAGARRYGRHSY